MYEEKPSPRARGGGGIVGNTLYSYEALTPGLEPRPELVKGEFFNL